MSHRLSLPLSVAAIWVPVIYLLGAQWSLYAEYQYGWAVPCLCLYLSVRRAGEKAETLKVETPKTEILKSGDREKWSVVRGLGFAALFFFGLVYWGFRVLQEANPLWRVASYGLALAAVALTLLAIYLTQGGRRAAHFAFPVAFFLVAVPWPTPVEAAVIQTLTRLNANLVVDALGFAGVPALLHGNVIEISAGMVGIDEACSGIRSFQATLMIALFFGEFYRFNPARRGALLAAGPLLALGFNFARTLVLVFVAARSGLPTMARWHDPTGVILLLGCFSSLWAVALWLARKSPSTLKSPISDLRPLTSDLRPPVSGLSVSGLAFCLLAWSLMVEVSTETWFRSHEQTGGRMLAWTARWPAENSTLQTNIIPKNSLQILQCDQNASASWTGDAGIFWQAFFLRWLPANSFYGRAKIALSKGHNPAICLPASGMELQAQLDPVTLAVRPGFNLAFDRYVFAAGGRELYVFFSQTEDMGGGGQASSRLTHLARWRAALAGSRNYGQNNFEVALAGLESPAAALRVFSARLPDLIEIQPANGSAQK